MPSDKQPPGETGTNSTNSQKDSTAVREGIEGSEGVDRLGKLVGVDSLANNLETEDAEYKRSLREHERELSDGSPAPAEASNEMRNMAARDIHVYQRPEPAEPTPAPDVPQLPVKAAGRLAKVALGAAILASGGLGAGVTALLLNRFAQPPAENVDQDTKYEGGIRVE